MSFALGVISKSSLILICAAFVCITLRRASAARRHAVWALAILGVLLLPLAAAILPPLQLPILPTAERSAQLVPSAAETTLMEAEPGIKPSAGYSMAEVLGGLWAAGVVFFLLRILAGAFGVLRLARTADASEDEGLMKLIAEIVRSSGSCKQVRLLFSELAVSPMTWGLRRHTVLLPSSAREWSVERLRLVLAHELAHVERKDGIIQLFVQLACSFYWFNPLIWFAARRAFIERERACDDQVLSLGAAAEDYADHLIQIVRGLQHRRSLAFTAVAMAQPSQLESRLASLLDSRIRRCSVSKAGLVALSVLAGLVTIGVASINLTGAIPSPPILLTAPKPAPPAEPETETPVVPSQRTYIGREGTVTSSSVLPPQVIESTAPLYASIEGTVTLEASVDVQGRIQSVRVVKGLTSELDGRALEEVMTWKFAPALKDGMAVSAVTLIDVAFTRPPVFHISRENGIAPPAVLSRVEPHYTDEARSAHCQGTVVLEAVVHANGSVDVVRVVHSVGCGLDDSAISAMKQWVFRPGTKNGEPVDIALNIEVNFHLDGNPPADAGPPRKGAAGNGVFTLKTVSAQ